MEQIIFSPPTREQYDKILREHYSLLWDLKSIKPLLEEMKGGMHLPIDLCECSALERILKEVSEYQKEMEGIK